MKSWVWILVAVCVNASSSSCDEDGAQFVRDQQAFLELSNGVRMPRVGFGLGYLKNSDAQATQFSVREHVKAGFVLMDGAEHTYAYDEVQVGEELATLEDVKREQLFYVSKVSPNRLSYEETHKSVWEMMERFNRTSYMDLVYLHTPECNQCPEGPGDRFGAWRALEEHYHAGRIRALGVSNFMVDQLEDFFQKVSVTPHVVQSWLDPFQQQRPVYEFCVQHNVVFTAYSLLGTVWEKRIKRNLVKESQVLAAMAHANGISVHTLVMAWYLSKPNTAMIPRSKTLEHIQSNARFLDPQYFAGGKLITPWQIRRIDAMDGVYNYDNDQWCEHVKQSGECGSNNWNNKCVASCQGINY